MKPIDPLLMPLIALAITFISAVILAVLGIRHRDRRPSKVGAFPIFRRFPDEVGRAAEEGALIHVTLGSGSLLGEEAMTSVAALESLTALMDLAAAYDTPPIITVGDPTTFLLADDWMRRSYVRIGNAARYRPTLVHFLASNRVAYAAMAASYLYEKGVGANLMLGWFGPEASLLTEAAVRRGAFTIGGTTSPMGLSALYPALKPTRLIAGEELFAGGAEASAQRATYWASLRTQDLLRVFVTVALLVLAGLSFLGITGS
ncbi:MAG: hypothetical protein JXB35_05265 [Anaerolineae bacterium]|nr:hypothetical protein [Anaerolineae bacterium]